jgi:hypothetical protein
MGGYGNLKLERWVNGRLKNVNLPNIHGTGSEGAADVVVDNSFSMPASHAFALE